MAKRRGLSTIVGSLIFVVIIISAFGTLVLGLGYMTSFQEKSIEISNRNYDQTAEDFGVRSLVNADCTLDLEVVNGGTTAVEVVEIILLNSTDNEIARYDVNNAVVAPDVRTNVTDSSVLSLDGVSSQTIVLNTNKQYTAKVVTKLGTVKEKTFATGASCGSSPLIGKLIAIPPEIASGDTVTVMFMVINKEDVDIRNVTLANAAQGYNLTASPSGNIDDQELITDAVEPNIVAGGSTIFQWKVTLTGGIGQTITLSTYATDSFGDSTGTQSAEVKITREYTKQVVSQRLVAKPELFVIFPAPFGEVKSDEAGKAIWGVAVVNPTDTSFTISRVTFRTTPVTTDSSEKHIEEPTSQCDVVGVTHSTAQWSCPNENTLTWASTSEPALQSRDVRVFMARVDPGTTGSGGVDLAAILVSVTVHTSLGQFTKGNYAINMEGKDDGASANVYLTTATTESGALANSNMRGSVSMSTSSTDQAITVVVAEFNREEGAYINSGGKLIVNVPAGFSDVTVTSTSKLSAAAPITYPDGSTQIIATLTENIGDRDVPSTAVDEEAALLTFTVTPPPVDETRFYIMYILIEADSTSTSGTPPPADAFAEIPIMVTFP